MFEPIKLYPNNNIAIHNKGTDYTFAQIVDILEFRSKFFQSQGVLESSHVCLLIRSSFDLLLSYIALWNLGATIIVLDAQINITKISELLKLSDSQFFLTDGVFIPEGYSNLSVLSETVLLKRDSQLPFSFDPRLLEYTMGSVILFTSGSQGFPKPVVLKKISILNNIKKVINYTKITHQDSTIISLPLSYSYAMSQTLCHLLVGGLIIFNSHGYLVENIIECIKDHKTTNYAATPYFYKSLLELLKQQNINNSALSSIKFFMNAGGYLSPDVIRSILYLLPKVEFFNNYGQTEASPRLSYAKFSASSPSFTGVGKPLPGVKFKIASSDGNDKGEILYKSEDVMLGYYGSLNSQSLHEWQPTGDLGVFIEGELHVLGRLDSMMKINGRKVYKNKIEDTISIIEGVKYVNLEKQMHNQYGEYLIANVVPFRSDMDHNDLKNKIKSVTKKTLSATERPQKIFIINDVQLTSNGKTKLDKIHK